MTGYNAEPLQIFSTVEAIRHRPAMYIGDVAVPGLHHLFKEIIDNSVDEVLAGHCDHITVILGKDCSLTVEDNGRGLPPDTDAETGKSLAELIMTELHVGSNFRSGGYKSSGGFGAGVPCVNALSEWMETTVRRDGKIYRMCFARGVPVSPLEVLGDCGPEEHGTTQRWRADQDIFKDALTDVGELDYRSELLVHMTRELAFLNREVAITFHDALHDAAPIISYYPKGIATYVEALNEGEEVLHDPIYLEASHEETLRCVLI